MSFYRWRDLLHVLTLCSKLEETSEDTDGHIEPPDLVLRWSLTPDAFTVAATASFNVTTISIPPLLSTIRTSFYFDLFVASLDPPPGPPASLPPTPRLFRVYLPRRPPVPPEGFVL